MHTEPSFTSRLVADICADQGYTVQAYPEAPSLFRVVFPEGHSTVFYSSTLNCNGAGSRVVAVDKLYTKWILKEAGISVPEGNLVLLPASPEEVLTAESGLSYPMIVKPIRGYQGKGVSKVHDTAGLTDALEDLAAANYRSAMTEEMVSGNEYRIVMYRGELVAAYQKTPLAIMGNGESTIGELIEDKRMEHLCRGRGDTISGQRGFIEARLAGIGYTTQNVLPIGFELVLRDNANLSTGGDVVDCTAEVAEDVVGLAREVAMILDLDLIGIDIVVEGTLADFGRYWVLEVAHTPGMQHFASLGEEQYARVRMLYTRIIEAIRYRHHA